MRQKYAQITLKCGTSVQIGVATTAEFKKMRKKIIEGGDKFVSLIDACSVRCSEVALIELLVVDIPDEEDDEEDED